VVDAGMEVNYFDQRLIEGYLGGGKTETSGGA
jgi:hypothetical protein